jgi:hypothetical protein
MIKSSTYYRNEKGELKQRQAWEIGQKVNVGFMKGLEVVKVDAIKDGMPDIYTLKSEKGLMYTFTPHNGLSRIWV